MNDSTEYEKCLEVMYGLRRFGIKLGLDVIEGILAGLGNPQNRYRCIHVAGSNGKGSIASMLTSILGEAGFSVGLYTSPHLVRFNERINIDGCVIKDHEVVEAYNAVREVHRGERTPTFFEFTTAMAFWTFARHRVDWAVVETGMGGRLDATNVLTPDVSVISNISMEHQMYLGNSIASIAAEKGGIIKKGVPVVTGTRQPSALEVLRNIAADRNAPLYRLGKEFKTRRSSVGRFSYYGIHRTLRDVTIELQGEHQVTNAALALAASEVLRQGGVEISDETLLKGLASTRWPGRLEIVAESPRVILDGAHNLAAAKNLGRYLEKIEKTGNIILVIGILDDKPYTSMLKSLLPAADLVVLTRPTIDRALDPEVLKPVTAELGVPTVIRPDVPGAVAYALEAAEPRDLICIAGSLYVVGEAKAWFEHVRPFTI